MRNADMKLAYVRCHRHAAIDVLHQIDFARIDAGYAREQSAEHGSLHREALARR
ncbi:hypothetical protein [Caballeronia sp. HLA56]